MSDSNAVIRRLQALKQRTDIPPEQPDEPQNAAGKNEFIASALDMRPDLTQPRRAVPPSLAWNGDPSTVGGMFDSWIGLIASQLGRDENTLYEQYKQVVSGHLAMDDVADDHQIHAERRFLALLDLAFSLKVDKQINSVVVVKRADGLLQIENGERRWLASLLLVYLLRDEQYVNVRVRIESEFNRFRQGAENIARADLNMVSRARQYALYMMEILKEQGAARITPYEFCQTDHAYYAQVASFDVPDGKLQTLMNALGVKSKASIAAYKAVLKLPADQWLVADEQDWSKDRIGEWFTIVNQPTKHGKLTRKVNGQKKTKTVSKKSPLTAYKNQFEREFKKPEKHEVLAQELDDLEAWIRAKRAELGQS